MSLEALSIKEKTVIKATLARLNTMYGSGGRIVRVNWPRRTVTIRGGATPERPFGLGYGARPNTFRVKFAGQQAVTKRAALE